MRRSTTTYAASLTAAVGMTWAMSSISSGAWAQKTEPEAPPPAVIGHSAHGSAYDQGPRQKPWKMDGIGSVHFEVTTSVPEAQVWYDQGLTLLHNFWYYEAERSFRWCLKLDPECAMAYVGLARCEEIWKPSERRESFLREAVARKDTVSEHERMYIETFSNAFLPEFAPSLREAAYNPMRSFKTLAKEIELIILAYPDDIEAKSLFALASLFNDTRYGGEAVIREILAVEPEHPGAHHYRIHTWDGKEGAEALDSCEVFGKIARDSGHANHMPGHIYSGIGLWHEGAIWMDSATRVEKKYMERRMTLPFHNWNYSHNRNYLSFLQEQLGMPSLALDGAMQLLRAPHDPLYNKSGEEETVHDEGQQALVRALIKFERWDDILRDDMKWGSGPKDVVARALATSLAHLAAGDLPQAIAARDQLVAAKREFGAVQSSPFGGGDLIQRALDELAGRIELERGNVLEGMLLLSRAAEEQAFHYRDENDPPVYPHLIFTVLGEKHLERKSPGLAAECFQASLDICPNDGFALSGLARAQFALGDTAAAANAYGRLLFVWSDCEPGLRWMEDAKALELNVYPIDDGPRPQRNYRAQTLDSLGPQQWRPYAAPQLDALDAESKRVSLEEYRGQNVLLVFYLGDQCVHCVEQLHAIGERAKEFQKRDVALLAISSDTVADNADALELGDMPVRLLSDSNYENARRFHSYDDFEEMELHSTILIGDEGRIRWSRTGGDPFMDLDFLLGEIDRVNSDEDLYGPTSELAASGG